MSGPLRAGVYRLVADGFIHAEPRVRFELSVRPPAGPERPIATFEHQYPPGDFARYEERQTLGRVAANAGDLLTLRISLVGGAPETEAAFVPVAEAPQPPGERLLSIVLPGYQ